MGGTHIALAGRLVKERGQGLRSPTAEAGRARHRPAVGSRGGGLEDGADAVLDVEEEVVNKTLDVVGAVGSREGA